MEVPKNIGNKHGSIQIFTCCMFLVLVLVFSYILQVSVLVCNVNRAKNELSLALDDYLADLEISEFDRLKNDDDRLLGFEEDGLSAYFTGRAAFGRDGDKLVYLNASGNKLFSLAEPRLETDRSSYPRFTLTFTVQYRFSLTAALYTDLNFPIKISSSAYKYQ